VGFGIFRSAIGDWQLGLNGRNRSEIANRQSAIENPAISSMIVDSHQHFWQVGRFDYPWMSPELGVLYRDYLPEDLESILKQCGVARTVLVQASNSLAETKWLLSLADKHSFIAGVVGWVDLTATDIEHELEGLTANPKFKGVRHLVESEPDEDWLVQPSVLAGLQKLAALNLSYDLLVHTRHLKHVSRVAETCPNLRLVIDHMAKPPIQSGEVGQWASKLKVAAGYANVHCKLSGLVTEANHRSWRPEDLRPFVDCALEYFGPKRMMFGSDWPVCLLAASYNQVLDCFRLLTSELSDSDQDAILAGNSTAFYQLDLRQYEASSSEFSL
jgi:L-fuconolactonase